MRAGKGKKSKKMKSVGAARMTPAMKKKAMMKKKKKTGRR